MLVSQPLINAYNNYTGSLHVFTSSLYTYIIIYAAAVYINFNIVVITILLY